ncbi:hypothetical protein HYH02_015075 [Chlamydomonas schloesseri]|uniref:Major facilitator superfamily (MFS) profile domain-containing protein n=1 Tax=Chlamydomonas schloesseri TaxID=2026947 RepID=A0A835SGI5_9CHLO|nr:hypothetical protein HYH02_015075 [Chlamydomonas schloesseri]|eukprot:KAG2425131.1 hypothetical protein HYH02_015075 [Chlamydomonas schloesseri]
MLLLTWLDLGIFASNYVTGDNDAGEPQGVKAAFGLSGFQLGLLPALYALGLVVAGFGFAEAARSCNAFRLMGVGMAVWAAGAVLTGAAGSYGMLVVARTVVGCGEAPLLTLTFTFVDDVAPAASKTLWFGVLGVFPTLGVAAGFVAAEPLVAGLGGWRGPFFLEAGLAVPLVLFCLLMPPVHLDMGAGAGAGPSSGGTVGGAGGDDEEEQEEGGRRIGIGSSGAAGVAFGGNADGGPPGTEEQQQRQHSYCYGTLAGGPPMATVGAGAGGSAAAAPSTASAGAGAGASGSDPHHGALLRHRPSALDVAAGGAAGAGAAGAGAAGRGARGGTGGGGSELRTPLTGGMESSSSTHTPPPAPSSGPHSTSGHKQPPPQHPLQPSPARPGRGAACGAHGGGSPHGGGGTYGGSTYVSPHAPLALGAYVPPHRPHPHHPHSAAAAAAAQVDDDDGENGVEYRPDAERPGGTCSTHRGGGCGAGSSTAAVGAAGGGRAGRWLAAAGGRLRGGCADCRALLCYPAVCLNNFGYAPVQWVLGMLTFWGPKAIKETFNLSGSGPELVLGAITVVSGVVGTLAGGWALDRAGSSLRNGFALQAAATAAALLLLEVAFMAVTSYPLFCVLLALGLLALFGSQAPSYALSMWTVPLHLRPLSQASIILLQHLIGDVPSPPVAGALHDATGSWRRALAGATAYLGGAVVLFAAGAVLAAAGRAADFRREEGEEEEAGEEEGFGGEGGAPGAVEAGEWVVLEVPAQQPQQSPRARSVRREGSA